MMPLICQREPIPESEIKKTGWKQPQAHSMLKKRISTKNIAVTSQSNTQIAVTKKTEETIEEKPQNAENSMSK